MGFLKIFGIVLKFDESKKYFKIIRDNFVKYVIRELNKRYTCKEPMFGFEFEFHKINVDKENKKIVLDLSAQNDIINSSKENHCERFQLSHEYGGWMFEVIPQTPFQMKDLDLIESSVEDLYKYLNEKYGNNKFLSLGSYPHLGVGHYYINEVNNSERGIGSLKKLYAKIDTKLIMGLVAQKILSIKDEISCIFLKYNNSSSLSFLIFSKK